MRQFIGSIRDESTVHDLLVSVAPQRVRAGGRRGSSRASSCMMERDDESAQMRYARPSPTGATPAATTPRCSGTPAAWPRSASPMTCRWRDVNTLSGGEQKRLVLEALLRGPDEVLLLDEPDNYLDVPGKLWLEQATPRDAQDGAARVATTVSCWPAPPSGSSPSSPETSGCTAAASRTYAQARRDRNERLEELRRRWDEEHAKIKALVLMLKQKAKYEPAWPPRYQSAQTRLRRFEEAGPPEVAPRDQNIKMRLRGGRTGKRAVICEGLELTGLMRPFDTEVWYGERVAVLGSNGSGKSHFLRLLMPGSESGAHRRGRLGAPGRAGTVRADPRPAGARGRTPVRDRHERARPAAQRGDDRR